MVVSSDQDGETPTMHPIPPPGASPYIPNPDSNPFLKSYTTPSKFQPPSKRVLRQGWIYRKASLISAWRPRWAVLISYGDHGTKELLLFDHRERASSGAAPRRILKFETPRSHSRSSTASDSTSVQPASAPEVKVRLHPQPTRRHLLDFHCYLYPFDVVLGKKKWTVAVQTRKEVDDWVNAIGGCPNGSNPGADSNTTLEGGFGVVKFVGQDTEIDDDCVSIRTTNTEALSLCESQILSCDELNVLKSGQFPLENHTSAPPSTSLDPFDSWNENYQAAVAVKAGYTEAILQQDLHVSEIIGNFSELVQVHGTKIIDGLHQSKKRSWVVGNILFYLPACFSTSESNSSDSRAADGLSPHADDENPTECMSNAEVESALRRASQELLGINAISSIAANGSTYVHTTLMAVLDYKGFRLVAYALMPVESSQTLCFDVTSANRAVADNQALDILDQIGKHLNLAEHSISIPMNDDIILVRCSANVEMHCCKAGRYYMINVCDILPVDIAPTRPSVVNQPSSIYGRPSERSQATSCAASDVLSVAQSRLFISSTKPQGSLSLKDLSRRLRPEYVRIYRQPLSPDVLSPLAVDSVPFEKQLRQASEELQMRHIPAFVRILDSLEVTLSGGEDLTKMMHEYGINVRYLGNIANLTKLPYIKECALLEMVVRSIKWHMRNVLQKSVLNLGKVGAVHVDVELKSQVQRILTSLEHREEAFWRSSIIPRIHEAFEYSMTIKDMQSLNPHVLLMAVQASCGLRLGPTKLSELAEFVPKLKVVRGTPFHDNVCRTDEDLHIYRLARHLATLGPKGKLIPNDVTATKFNDLATHYNKTQRFSEALAYSTAAYHLSTQSKSSTALINLNLLKAKMGLGQLADCDALAKDALNFVHRTVGANHPLALSVLQELASAFHAVGQKEKALEFFEGVVTTSSRILGHNHLRAAEARLMAGKALLESRRYELGKRYLEEAYQVFQAQRAEESVADTAILLSQSYKQRGDIAGALKKVGEATAVFERLFGSNHGKTASAYRLTADLYLLDQPFVMTTEARQNSENALQFLEKLFKYIRTCGEETRQQQLGVITAQMLRLKTRLLTNQSHREVVKRLEASKMRPEAWRVTQAVVKMLHMTPSAFFDDVLTRMEADDAEAISDLLVLVELMDTK